MSQADVERFVEDLKNNEELRAELTTHASGIGSVVSFANDKGYDIDAAEASAYISAQSGRELSDADLDAVAGGKGHHNQTSTSSTNVATNVESTAEVVQAAAAATTTAAVAETVAVAVIVLT